MSKQVKFYLNENKFKKGDKSPSHQSSFKDGVLESGKPKYVSFMSAWSNDYGMSVSLDLDKLKRYMELNPDKVSEIEFKKQETKEVKSDDTVDVSDLPF